MTEGVHPNLSVMQALNIHDLDACRSIVADDFVWHYFNPQLPELEGDYHGIDGWKKFFSKLGEICSNSFQRNVLDGRPAGDELVVTHVSNAMKLEGRSIEFDAVVVWRIVDSKIAEAWDIPAVNTVRSAENS